MNASHSPFQCARPGYITEGVQILVPFPRGSYASLPRCLSVSECVVPILGAISLIVASRAIRQTPKEETPKEKSSLQRGQRV